MHMNSAPHLLPEDRPEFERAVDEALRTAALRPALEAAAGTLSADQLRTRALSAASAIAATAADEYAHFTGLRSEMRHPSGSASRPGNGDSGSGSGSGHRDDDGGGDADDSGTQGGRGGLSLAGAMGEGISESPGAGLAAMVSVLVPLLAGTAAVIFLLLGYVLRVMTPDPSIAAPMRGAGWVFAVLAVAGIVVGMAELWLTALRNGAGARRRAAEEGALDAATDSTDSTDSLAAEVSKARAAWREALMERGIHPYLTEALADGQATRAPSSYVPEQRPEGSRADERHPRLGYSGPDFSSRSPSDGKGDRSVRPRYSSPDFSSPDYSGPDYSGPEHSTGRD
jgi:hypothetical protein